MVLRNRDAELARMVEIIFGAAGVLLIFLSVVICFI